MFRTLRAFSLASAEASQGGSTLELPGVSAAIVPSMPERSVVNCVVYEDAEALGGGLASRLLLKALADARGRGCSISTLQATRAGYPVYARLGYRDFGRVQMWERRKPAPSEA